MIVQQWKQAGIDAKVDVAQGTLPTRRAAGDFDTFIGWSVETWGGHSRICPTSWIAGIRSSSPSPGKSQPQRKLAALVEPGAGKIIEETRTIGFDDPKIDRARQGLRQARGEGNANHSADGV